MRITKTLSAAALMLGLAVTPAAADSSPSPSASGGDSAPTTAGTSFRTAAEIGQGSSTLLVQTVAEVLGLDMLRVRVVTGDSEVVPKDNGSYSSRVTFMVGNAAIDAAQNLKRVLVNAAARKLDAKPEEIECLGELYRAGA